MKRLSITQLVPGMTVAEDVYDLDHELLIQKGTAIVPVYTMTRPVLVLISPIGLSSLYSAVMDKRDGNA